VGPEVLLDRDSDSPATAAGPEMVGTQPPNPPPRKGAPSLSQAAGRNGVFARADNA